LNDKIKRKERGKSKREKEKYYLYIGLRLITLSYTGWVGLSGIKRSQLAPYPWYLFIRFFNLLSFEISILSNFNKLSQVK